MAEDKVVNSLYISCPKSGCTSIILRPTTAELVQRPQSTPLPEFGAPIERALSLSPAELEEKQAGWFWLVHDMMDFDNIGFSKTSQGIKYLSCAECDLAPVGYHDTQSEPREYLVAVDRVTY
ncbi:hypothetical protein IWW55_001821, partial [Coemansia sp. RSA 2706]